MICVETRTIPRMVELEVPLRGRRPDLPDALVRPRDPDDLARRDRLALGRLGEPLSADHDGGRLRGARSRLRPAWPTRPGTAPSQARPRPFVRRRAHTSRDARAPPRRRRRGARRSRCPSRRPGRRGGTGPRGRGSCPRSNSSSSVTLYERYGSRVRRCCCIASASRRDCSPFSGETMLSVMNAR